MNIIIIEDELPASRRLQGQIEKLDGQAKIITILDSIHSAVQWLTSNPQPDLIFCDIQLADGLSFKIFEEVEIDCPIIFTTAFDEYALKAFEVNSIDYLLKPIDSVKLSKSLEKFHQRHQLNKSVNVYGQLNELIRSIHSGQKSYKTRFLVKLGDKLFPTPAENIRYFIAEDKLVFLINDQGKKYPVDFTLDDLEGMLDPSLFFRLNRQFTAHIHSIEKVTLHLNGKLRVFLHHISPQEEIYVSREKAAAFKAWLGNE